MPDMKEKVGALIGKGRRRSNRKRKRQITLRLFDKSLTKSYYFIFTWSFIIHIIE